MLLATVLPWTLVLLGAAGTPGAVGRWLGRGGAGTWWGEQWGRADPRRRALGGGGRQPSVGSPLPAAPGVRGGAAGSCALFAIVGAGEERWLGLCEFDRR